MFKFCFLGVFKVFACCGFLLYISMRLMGKESDIDFQTLDIYILDANAQNFFIYFWWYTYEYTAQKYF